MSDEKLRFGCPGCSKTLAVAAVHVGKTVCVSSLQNKAESAGISISPASSQFISTATCRRPVCRYQPDPITPSGGSDQLDSHRNDAVAV